MQREADSGRSHLAVSPSARDVPLWTLGFRPFFLLAGLWGLLAPLMWVAMFEGIVRSPYWLTPSAWHAHEMVFGWVVAAITGFLLTAVPNWTSTKPVKGRALFLLAALWTAGRLAMLASGFLPPLVVAAIDVSFLPALVACLLRPLVSIRQRRNWGFVPVLIALWAANVMMHAEALQVAGPRASAALRFAIALIALLIVVIGGRITPAFTQSAFIRRGMATAIHASTWRARASIAFAALYVAAELGAPRTPWSGAAALVAAVAVALRMCGWQTLRTLRDPLLWSLHAGYAWIAIGLALIGLGDLFRAVPVSAGLHALTAGAMGSMILAVMTRVSLGHTGRPLVAPRGVAVAYTMVHLGAATRVVATLLPNTTTPALVVAAMLWAGAFGLFVALYAPILLGPRVDASGVTS